MFLLLLPTSSKNMIHSCVSDGLHTFYPNNHSFKFEKSMPYIKKTVYSGTSGHVICGTSINFVLCGEVISFKFC